MPPTGAAKIGKVAPSDRLARRDPYGGQQVRRPLGAREGWVPHRARHNNRRFLVHEKVQHKRRLLYGIGALSYDDASDSLVDASPDLLGEPDQVVQGQLRAGHLAEGLGRDLGDL
jgi:hypothetical protein